MKQFLKEKLIIPLLRFYCKVALTRTKPFIIAITGSIGKTTTKEAIGKVLVEAFTENNVLVPSKSYNTEIGVPLTVLGLNVPKNVNSIFGWLYIIIVGFFRGVIAPKKFKYAVLEMGADKPGDIGFLTEFIKPNISVVTAVAPVHLEEFKTIEAVATEKFKLVEALNKEGIAILNGDDPFVWQMGKEINAKVIYFGEKAQNDFVLKNTESNLENGLSFTAISEKNELLVKIPSLYPPHFAQSAMPAIVIAKILGINEEVVKKSLVLLKPAPGRFSKLDGLNQSIILDDSYNASPKSVLAGLNYIKNLKNDNELVLVLGNMNELGENAKKYHQEVGEFIFKNFSSKNTRLITVGENARDYIAGTVLGKGFSRKNVNSFMSAKDAGIFLKRNLKRKSLIYFKGSQNGVRLELAVKEVLKEPERAGELLCRQGPEWTIDN